MPGTLYRLFTTKIKEEPVSLKYTAGELDSADYKTIKHEAENKIAVLEVKLSEIPINLMEFSDIESILDRAIVKFTQIDKIYCKSDVSIQRKIIGSMFPEKFTFES